MKHLLLLLNQEMFLVILFVKMKLIDENYIKNNDSFMVEMQMYENMLKIKKNRLRFIKNY